MIQMGTKPHEMFHKWAIKYGKLYTIYLAQKPALVVNDQKLLKELFGMIAATGTFQSELFLMVTGGHYGFGGANVNARVEQKQFLVRELHKFGVGRGSCIEPFVFGEIETFCDWMKSEQLHGNKLYLNNILKQTSSNLLWTMVTGERMKSHESKIVKLLDNWMQHLQIVTNTGLIFFSWIKYLAPEKSGYLGYKKVTEELRDYVKKCFETHAASRIVGEEPRDIIEAYIQQMERCQDPESSFYGEAGLQHCIASVAGLLLAGGESTGSMLNWLIFHLIVHPSCQMRLQEEIDTVVGQKRNPNLGDKLNMPYTEAVILETLRYKTLAPFGVIHELLEDIEFEGYQLPKGLLLMPNLYHVLYDKSIWGDPEVFRPERFLEGSDDLKEFVVSFQPGKRSCMGEPLAKDVLFLFATTLFQKYTFSADTTSVRYAMEYLEPTAGFTLLPRSLPIIASGRG